MLKHFIFIIVFIFITTICGMLWMTDNGFNVLENAPQVYKENLPKLEKELENKPFIESIANYFIIGFSINFLLVSPIIFVILIAFLIYLGLLGFKNIKRGR